MAAFKGQFSTTWTGQLSSAACRSAGRRLNTAKEKCDRPCRPDCHSAGPRRSGTHVKRAPARRSPPRSRRRPRASAVRSPTRWVAARCQQMPRSGSAYRVSRTPIAARARAATPHGALGLARGRSEGASSASARGLRGSGALMRASCPRGHIGLSRGRVGRDHGPAPAAAREPREGIVCGGGATRSRGRSARRPIRSTARSR